VGVRDVQFPHRVLSLELPLDLLLCSKDSTFAQLRLAIGLVQIQSVKGKGAFVESRFAYLQNLLYLAVYGRWLR
jgi:hypothetical protein